MQKLVSTLEVGDIIAFKLSDARMINNGKAQALIGVIDGFYMGKVQSINVGTSATILNLTDSKAYMFPNLHLIERICPATNFQFYQKTKLHNGRSID